MSRKDAVRKRKKQQESLLTGVFSASRQGFGFVQTDEGEVFIPNRGVGRAVDGDTVRVRITDRSNPLGPAGSVAEITERSRAAFVGIMLDGHNVRPLDPVLPQFVGVSGGIRGAKRGDWVAAHLLDSGKKFTEKLKCSIDELLGKGATVYGDLLAVAREFKMPEPYSAAAEKCAEKLEPLDLPRTDLSGDFTVTIDPADAKDFDDAVSIGEDEKFWHIGVHIADVSAWIHPGSKFDKTASERGFSSYIPGMFRPMLPKPLTRKISLTEGELSPAHTIRLKVSKASGKVVAHERFHSNISVNFRLDYDRVQEFLDSGKAPKKWTRLLKNHLAILASATDKMRKYRAKTEQFLQIDTVETRVLCDETLKTVTGLEKRVQKRSDEMIEECMLAANTAAAEEMIERGIPGLYRIHPEPDPAKLEEFEIFAESILKKRTGDLSNRKILREFLTGLPDDHTRGVVTGMFLRAMQRAGYSADPALHYGLGKTRYAHFTSPIRRYSDLFTHQQLLAFDLKKRMRSKKSAQTVADSLGKLEKRTDEAYFAASDRLKLHYLKQLLEKEPNRMFEAVVVKLSSAGFVCDVDEFGLRGFVPSRLFTTILRRHPPKPGNFIYLYLDSMDFAGGAAIFRPV